MITLVLGGQYGSEGKGSVVSWLAERFEFDLVIRTGSPNAGHTFKANQTALIQKDEIFKMRQLPCTWAFQNAPIYIPAGAVISLEVLEKEIKMVKANGYKGNIYVSPQASVIEDGAIQWEKMINTGTTGEGVGATRASKCLRNARLVSNFDSELQKMGCLTSTHEDWYEVHHLIQNSDKHILIESTQGFGLSLDYRFYPFCTSTNLTTYRVLDDAEIPYGLHEVGVFLVLRTFPIRIAGNSGFLFNETSWDALRKQYGNHIPDEQTTVTKKLRRVGAFDPSLAQEAVKRNKPDLVVLTFVDYVFPNIEKSGITSEIKHWLVHMEAQIEHQIDYIGVGIGKLIPLKR